MLPIAHRHLTRRRFAALSGAALWTAASSAVLAQEQTVFTFLVLGLDTREDNADIRSDAIMVSRVDLAAASVRTLSIPRDLYVEIPGYGDSKINDAYQFGLAADPQLSWQSGASLTRETIAHNLGVAVDGVAVSDLLRFPPIVDAVGGIEVDNPYAVYVEDFYDITNKRMTTLDFPEGSITLSGAEAILYVQTRQQDGDGGRVMRQHLVLAALLKKLQQPEILPRIRDLIAAVGDAVRTDIPPDLQVRLIAAIPTLADGDVAFTNIDHLLWSDYTPDGAWIYQGDWSVLPGYVEGWLAGSNV